MESRTDLRALSSMFVTAAALPLPVLGLELLTYLPALARSSIAEIVVSYFIAVGSMR